MRRPEFMIEDRVWFMPDGGKFAVLSTVIGISRSIHPDSFYFYDIDEPVGHSVPENELCLKKYQDSVIEAIADHIKNFPNGYTELEEWRKAQVDAIYSTHVKAYSDNTERYHWLEEGYYPARAEDEIIGLE